MHTGGAVAETKEARINLMTPSDLLEAFDRTAAAEDLTRSQAIRHLMRRYVAEKGQADWVGSSGRGRKGAKGANK